MFPLAPGHPVSYTDFEGSTSVYISDIHVLKDRTSQIENDQGEKVLEREYLPYSRSEERAYLSLYQS